MYTAKDISKLNVLLEQQSLKICSTSGQILPLEAFHKNGTRLRSKCKVCERLRSRTQKNIQYATDEAFRESRKAYSIQYHKLNRAERISKGLLWAKNNKDLVNIKCHKRRSLKRALPSTLTNEQWQTALKNFDNSCAYCGSTSKIQQEHVLAVSMGGGYEQCNIIPACQTCNYSKNNKDMLLWYTQQPFFTIKRLENILEYIHRV